MELSKKELEIFEKINLYERHSNISNQYRFEDKLKDYSNDKTIEIVKELGYSAKYRKKEKFFQIIEIIDGIKFYFHFSLEYGMVEVIIFWEYENNKDLSGGGLLSVVCKLIEIAKNEEKEGYIKKARFRNYEVLKTEVLKVDWNEEDMKDSE